MGPLCIVVMGVSGCGKSTIGRQLAQACGLPFLESDDLHSPENVERMRSGIALTDAQRQGWLERISVRLARATAPAAAQPAGLVVACSALKRAYRDVLRCGAPDLLLVYLHGDRALLEQRTGQREGHFMPASLLGSQFDTLEPPEADEKTIAIDFAAAPQVLVQQILAQLPYHQQSAQVASTAPSSASGAAAFAKTALFTDTDGRTRFRDEIIDLDQGTARSMLSKLFASGGYQLRHSPVGFRSTFHCTSVPQWVFILSGQMEIGLQQGQSRVFTAGQHFYSADLLPHGAQFDAQLHGHWSRQLGPDPLVTLFVRD